MALRDGSARPDPQSPRVVVATSGADGRYLAALLSRSGWWVSGAPSNGSALTLATTTDATLVLLDADQLDEPATSQHVRDHPRAGIVLFGPEAKPHLAVRVGATGVVPRPFEPAESMERIVSAIATLARREHPAPDAGAHATISRLVAEAAAALETSDWAGALASAETALALDPQNVAARMMSDSARKALLQKALTPDAGPSGAVAARGTNPVGRPSLEWALARSTSLLPLPAIASRIIATVSDPGSSISELTRLVQNDPALTSEVLRVANSAHYVRRSRVATVHEAIVVLGVNELRAIAFAACLARTTYRTRAVSLPDFWTFSLTVGLIADVLARTRGVGQEFAYTAGVVHNIGLLALDLIYPDELQAAVTTQDPRGSRLHDRERALLGFTDAELGGRLGETWGFPGHIIRVMTYHGFPADDLAETDFLVDYVIRARLLAKSQGMNDGVETSERQPLPLEWTVPPLSGALQALGGIDGIKARLEAFAGH